MSEKIWLMRFDGDYQFEIAKAIASDPRLTIDLCTVAERDEEVFGSLLGKNGETLVNNDICICPPHLKVTSPDKDWMQRIPEDEDLFVAIQNLDRNERFEGELTFGDRIQLVSWQYEFWTSKFEDRDPALIIFVDIPHMYYEIVILSIAKRFGVPCFILTDLFREGHIILDESLRPVETKAGKNIVEVIPKKLGAVNQGKKSEIDHVRAKELGFFALVSHLFSSFRLFITGGLKYSRGYFLKEKKSQTFGYPSNFSQAMQQIRYVWLSIRAIKKYEEMARKTSNFVLSEKYMYFPLPSGFENIINPLAAPLDLKDMIELALEALPQNHRLVIKEHPMQFKIRHSIRQRRTPEFYSWLESHDRIAFASLSSDHLSLIRGSQGVFALASSSTFVEALAMGVETKAFGKNKYKRGSSKFEKFSSLHDFDENLGRPGSIFSGSKADAISVAEDLVPELLARKKTE